MAGQFEDLLATGTMARGPRNVSRIGAAADGTLMKSIKGGFIDPLLPASNDAKDGFRMRAQAFLPPGFHTIWRDYDGAPTDVVASSFAATSAIAQMTTGRCGGTKMRFTESGAGGFHYEAPNTSQLNGGIGTVAANQAWDPWVLENRLKIDALTGNEEITIVGLTNQSGYGATDAGSPSHTSLVASGAISATNLVVKFWVSPTLTTVVTPFTFDLGVFHTYTFVNTGLGNLWVIRDGVAATAFTTPVIPLGPNLIGCLFHAGSARGGTGDRTVDYFAGAGMAD